MAGVESGRGAGLAAGAATTRGVATRPPRCADCQASPGRGEPSVGQPAWIVSARLAELERRDPSGDNCILRTPLTDASRENGEWVVIQSLSLRTSRSWEGEIRGRALRSLLVHRGPHVNLDQE